MCEALSKDLVKGYDAENQKNILRKNSKNLINKLVVSD